MVCPDFLAPQPLTLAPRLINNVYVTAEITYYTAHVRHELLTLSRGTRLLTRYSLGHELFCAECLQEHHHKNPGCCYTGLHCSNSMIMVYKVMLWLAILCLCCGCCYGCCVSQERINLSAFPMLLESPSSLLTHTLPTLCLAYSEESVNSETIGIMNRMKSNIATHSSILAQAILRTEEPSGLQSNGLSRVRYHLAPTLEASDQNTFHFLGACGYSTSQK